MNEEELKDGEGIAVKNEQDLEKVKEAIKEEVVKEHQLTPEQEEFYNKVLKEAQMPVSMVDADFTLGINELDIRNLSKKNKEQMMFRQGVLTIVYAKQIMTSLIDISRLLMVVADKLGVEDLIQATDDVIEKTKKARKDLNDFCEQHEDKKQA